MTRTRALLCLVTSVSISEIAVAKNLQELQLIRTIGTEETDGPDSFGVIEDIEVDGNGVVYVLDSGSNRLTAFNASGALVASIGRRGSGPEEFAAPSAMALSPSGEVYVLDRANARISVFTLREGFRRARAFRVDPRLHDICFLNGELYAYSSDEMRPLKQLNADGTIAYSFGEPLDPTNLIVSRMAGVATIRCVPEYNGVIVVGTLIPRIDFYYVDGTRRWTSRIPNFRQIRITPQSAGVLFSTPKDGPEMMTVNAIHHGRRVFIHYGEVSKSIPTARELSNVYRAEFDILTGRYLGVVHNTSRIDALAAANVYSVRTDPFPRINIFRRTR